MKRVLAYIASWIALALCIGLLVGAQNIFRLRALASQGIETQGVVLALEPAHHQAVRYSYRVGGVRYSGVDRVGYGNPEFGSLTVGDPISLYYAATTPEMSGLGDPHARLRDEISSAAIVAVVFPTLIVFAFVAKRRRFRP
jgi:hypothetical protein